MIRHEEVVRLAPEDAQRLDNVLADAPIDGMTRRHLVHRAAVTAAAAGAIGVLGPAGTALAQSGGNDPQTILNTAVTAEALAVTYLTGVIENVKGGSISKFETVLKAANQSEEDHYKALRKLGAKPITTKFWVPDALLEPSKVFGVIETLETLFVNAYLIGTTAFASAGKADAARYTGEIVGVEAQHRALARFAQGKLPDNVAFESYTVKTLSQIVSEITDLGIGFGQQGSSPGAFYTYGGTTPSTVLSLDTNAPDDKVAFTLPTLVAAPRKRTVKQAKKPTHKARRATAPRSMPKGNPKLTG